MLIEKIDDSEHWKGIVAHTWSGFLPYQEQRSALQKGNANIRQSTD
jgi:hypothetical protein